MSNKTTIPVIDIFAGPGGLGEGFSAFETGGHNPFEVKLSIEKDSCAHQTLRLRSFFRQFPSGKAPSLFYQALKQNFPISELPERLKQKSESLWLKWQQATDEAMQAELGSSEESHKVISKKIADSIGSHKSPWVLIGGPPCQAYSLAGRVRNKGIKNYRFEDDQRSTLYLEYLRIIAEHRPAIFVMENVKGMLSATHENQKLFQKILSDLSNPPAASPKLTYQIQSVVDTESTGKYSENDPRKFIVACEKYGVPQQRHRVILVGIRSDLGDIKLPPLIPTPAPRVNDVIAGLPRLRSGLSRSRRNGNYVRFSDNSDSWIASIQSQIGLNDSNGSARWLNELDHELASSIVKTASNLKKPRDDRGDVFIKTDKQLLNEKHTLYKWYTDSKLGGVCNHQTRSHLDSDLVRYLFAASYGKKYGISPRLNQFPAALLPDHKNASSGKFNDRFRVQLGNQAATTVTSHISKDGHYFIHPDPTQCRSLTVREAARLQTFPDNYYFCGPRTEQYSQVGNAVPPWVARQIAESVWNALLKAGKAG